MRSRDPYRPHRAFVAPALAKTQLWRVLLVIVGFEVVFESTPFIFTAPGADMAFGRTRVTPLDTLLEFAAFAIPCAALLFLIRLLHQRGLRSLTGPRDAVWRDMRRVAIAVSLAMLVPEIMRVTGDWDYFFYTRPLAAWLTLIPFALVALLIQVGTEELYFRGYLQQQLAARSQSPLVWMLGPSLFFGLAHFINGTTPLEGLVWAIWAACLGLACADLTARTGNLGAAIGLHLANNGFAILVTGVMDWPASGLALFLYPWQDPLTFDAYTPLIAGFELLHALTALLVMWLAARVALRR